jgi:hypothetical protein
MYTRWPDHTRYQTKLSHNGQMDRQKIGKLSRYRYPYGSSESGSEILVQECTFLRTQAHWRGELVPVPIWFLWILIQWIRIQNTCTGMYLSADPGALMSWVGTGTYTVSPVPDPKHSYRYVPIGGSRCTDEASRYRYLYGFSGSEFNTNIDHRVPKFFGVYTYYLRTQKQQHLVSSQM